MEFMKGGHLYGKRRFFDVMEQPGGNKITTPDNERYKNKKTAPQAAFSGEYRNRTGDLLNAIQTL